MSKETHHKAFLLRWQENEEQADWRALLQDAYTGKKIYFTDRKELLRFLWRAVTGSGEDGTRGVDKRGGWPM